MADVNTNMTVQLTASIWTEDDFVEAFNMWMDDFVNNPQKFEEISDTAHRHLAEKLEGKVPSYGESVTATLFEYCNKVKSENN